MSLHMVYRDGMLVGVGGSPAEALGSVEERSVARVAAMEAALRLTEQALVDLGACADPECADPNCLRALVAVRRALRGEEKE